LISSETTVTEIEETNNALNAMNDSNPNSTNDPKNNSMFLVSDQPPKKRRRVCTIEKVATEFVI
jgi:hypothetical protein